jgi:hypothetical protein
MKIYRAISLVLMLLFALTGLLFLFSPGSAVAFFNRFSSSFGMPQAPASGWNLYLILAVGYMYLVTLLAYLMFKHPENRYFPLLLAHAKLASSILSLALFLLHAHYLIYLANFVVDGAIGIVVLAMYMKMRKTEWVSS